MSASSITIPAPTKGWNASTSNVGTGDGYALVMDNVIPMEDVVEFRSGCSWHTTAATNPRSAGLLPYHPISGSGKLFLASDAGLFDITTPGTAVNTGVTWTHSYADSLNFTTAGGNFLFVVRNSNPVIFNGTAWTVLTSTSSPALTGVTASTIRAVSILKNRLCFCVVASLS